MAINLDIKLKRATKIYHEGVSRPLFADLSS